MAEKLIKKESHIIAKLSDFPAGTRKIVEINGRSIGVFNVDGQFYALRNRCPHQGGPLCLGRLSGTMLPSGPKDYVYGLENRVLSCPWHNWEFDITTGEMIFVPDPLRVKTYEVVVEHPSVETFAVAVEEDTVVLYL